MTDVYEKIKVKFPEEETIALPQNTDDLTKIKGIGSGTAEKLNFRKIYTYRQLAEITPEKLSEAPGIGIATARIFIEEAKKFLEGIQEENKVKVPEQSKEEPVITQKSKKEAVVPEERSPKKSKEKIVEYQEEIPEQLGINATVEPFESEDSIPIEKIPREENFNTPIYSELPEVTKISEVEIPKITEVQKVPEISKIRDEREETKIKIEKLLKNSGYYKIPSALEGLIPFFQNIDSIWSKLVSVNNNLKLIFLVPIKLCDLDGTILVDEEKIGYKAYSKAQRSDSVLTVNHYTNNLLRIQDAIFEDIVKGDKFRNFFQKYLQVRFTAEKSVKNETLFFVSGLTQYKILIEPILLTKIPAKCLEKSILFPYQRKTNLHIIERSNITTLLRFLENKYKLIESRDRRTNSIELYQNVDNKFRSSLRIASLPFLGYAVVLLVIYFSQLHFLLRLFNNIGFAIMGIYLFIIAYFYFKFYKTKKELTTEFKTPYYLQSTQFSETDLLYIKEEFTDEQMAQFGYECFGKENNFKVLEQIEKDTIKENIVKKQQEKGIPQLYELDSEPEYSAINKPKHEIKYSSFLED